MDGDEIIGDLAQGGLLARAVEPAHGEAKPGAAHIEGQGSDGHTHEAACLNCGTALVGSHCHACGQAAHVHRTLGAFVHDLLHGVFHFEGKIWRTLPLLAWNPGKLTREYIDGRRASYVSPIALFLFTVFLTFAVFNLLGSPIEFNNQTGGIAAAQQEARAEVGRLEAAIATARQNRQPTAALEGELEGAKGALDGLTAASEGRLPDEIATAGGASGGRLADAINATWHKAKTNPELLVYKLQSSAYKFSWLLIPLSVPFLWLLFPFSRRFHLYDHTVFVTYSLSFMLLLTTVISALMVWGSAGVLVALLLGYAPVHIYRQLRGAYGLSRFGAWWRTWLVSLFALIVVLLFALALSLMVSSG